jgi:hypothetical protein
MKSLEDQDAALAEHRRRADERAELAGLPKMERAPRCQENIGPYRCHAVLSCKAHPKLR